LEPLIETELPTGEAIERVFVDAGFNTICHEILTQVVASDWRSFVEKSALRADSFLARLADRDSSEGWPHCEPQAPRSTSASPLQKKLVGLCFARNPAAIRPNA
jgi:hypothetical protein